MSASSNDGRGGPVADAIIVGAGASRRMGGTDKLATLLLGRPVLQWAVAAAAGASSVRRIVLVAAPERVADLAAAAWVREVGATVVPGGARRQESVAAGLRALEASGHDAASTDLPVERRVVLVHDGARPLASSALIDAVAEAAIRHGAAIPVVPVVDTLKRLQDGVVAATVDRKGLVVAQTPQGIRGDLLRAAFARFPADGAREFTDEAALLEACRIPVHAIPGDPENLKVTVPADLHRAERALAGPLPTRPGIGIDAHPFGSGDGLRLAGIDLADAPRLAGHSDGDVALHAVADAFLGAASLGDLGRLFPSDARTPRGIDSRTLLGVVVDRLAEAGLRPASVDLTIEGARPRLGARLEEMRATLAGLLGLPVDQVSVKASSGNLQGATGAGRAIAATAIATVMASPTRGVGERGPGQ